jgi:hypothetical protein
VGPSGHVVVAVAFWNASQTGVAYSATQASTLEEAGPIAGAATISAGSSESSPNALSASVGTSTLTFGAYTLTIDVDA